MDTSIVYSHVGDVGLQSSLDWSLILLDGGDHKVDLQCKTRTWILHFRDPPMPVGVWVTHSKQALWAQGRFRKGLRTVTNQGRDLPNQPLEHWAPCNGMKNTMLYKLTLVCTVILGFSISS